MSDLWVGPNEAFTRIDTAVKAAHTGDTIFVRAGTYVDQVASVPANVNLIGVGGMVQMTATHELSNGKAFLISHGGTIENFDFSNASAGSQNNGAGIRYSSGDLVVKNSNFHDNQEGILAQNNATGTITLTGDHFTNNGAGDGFSHAVYVNQLAKLTVTDSTFDGTKLGHDIKSRADATVVTGSTFTNGAHGNGSYAIDLPNGGQAIIEGNSFDQSANSQNPAIVHFGGEGAPHGNSHLTVADNKFADELPGGVAVANQTGTPVDLVGNVLTGVGKLISGASQTIANAPSVPSSDTASSAPPVAPQDPATTTTGTATQAQATTADPTAAPAPGQAQSTSLDLPASTAAIQVNPSMSDSAKSIVAWAFAPQGQHVVGATTSPNEVAGTSGHDVFLFPTLSTAGSKIDNFQPGIDTLDLRVVAAGQDVHLTDVGGSTLVQVGNVGLVTLAGVMPTDLHASDFLR